MAKLYFYYSAMNAGKSTTLLQSCYNYEERGMSTVVFTFHSGGSSGNGPSVQSRIGLKRGALPFYKELDLFESIDSILKNGNSVDCVLVDEAQFLSKENVAQLVLVVKEKCIPVLCYGLRSDFLGEPFEGSTYMLMWADEIIEIKTICHCGSKATMNIRMDGSGNAETKGGQILIGGNEKYVSVCMKHYMEASGLFYTYAKRDNKVTMVDV